MPDSATCSRTRAERERGAAMVWAMLFVVITSGMIVAHAAHMASVRKELDARYDRKTMADSVVRSALTDTVGWFQSQAEQPVTEFAPALDPYGDPPRYETIDPRTGLVREFEIRGNLWARYEVRQEEVVDVSSQRGVETPGSVWAIGVRSYVFRIVDARKSFDEAPNRVVAQSSASTELRGMSLALPANGAISVQDPGTVVLGSNAVVDGGTKPGLTYGDGPTRALVMPTYDLDQVEELLSPVPLYTSPDPVVAPLATVSGTPSAVRLPAMTIDPVRVFRLRTDEMSAFADVIWMPGRNRLPPDVRGSFVLVPGSATIDGEDLDGVVLFVDGDLHVAAVSGGTTTIRGIVFVTGNATIDGDFRLDGSLSVMGELRLGDGVSPPAVVVYDQAAVDAVRDALRSYRLRRGSMPLQAY